VDQCGRQLDQSGVPINGGSLNGRDLMLAKAFANDVEAGR
jgi:hypothetical protein